MDQTLRIAKTLGIPKWRTLRIRVTNAKKDAEAELEHAFDECTFADTLTPSCEMEILGRVFTWMDQIEEALDE